ncbi:MAG TPA: malonic semialdehyde reductase [Sphingomicrobium sp.]|nr:malonic semialdehyde reductase [Sphingomicrobium sp.]
MVTSPIERASLDQLFNNARTHNDWSSKPVSDDLIRVLYDLVKMGPTSANSSPARFVWVRSDEGKRQLSDAAFDNNKAKILAAPVTVIVAYDLDFADRMPQLFPARGEAMKTVFKGTEITEPTAFRNSSLQAAYLILAARALGLDAGPMSGFDHQAVDQVFFAGTAIRSNLICSLGYGSGKNIFPRNPRLSFEEAGRFA